MQRDLINCVRCLEVLVISLLSTFASRLACFSGVGMVATWKRHFLWALRWRIQKTGPGQTDDYLNRCGLGPVSIRYREIHIARSLNAMKPTAASSDRWDGAAHCTVMSNTTSESTTGLPCTLCLLACFVEGCFVSSFLHFDGTLHEFNISQISSECTGEWTLWSEFGHQLKRANAGLRGR